MTLSADLRKRVIEAYDNKEGSQAQIAERFKVSVGTVFNWVNQPKEREPKPETRGRKSVLSQEALERLEKLALEHDSATETELAVMLAPEGEKPKHRSIIGRALRKMGLTRKKRHGEPANKTERTSKTSEESG